MADRQELEIRALNCCPTEEVYELRDSIDGASDDALISIIAEHENH